MIVDNSGGPAFLQIAKEFKMLPKNLELFEHDFLNFNFLEGMAVTKQNFIPSEGKIVHSQAFGIAGWIRLANENLQWMIEKKKIKFAARIFNDPDLTYCMDADFPIVDLHFSKIQGTGRDDKEENATLAKTTLESMKLEFGEHLGDMIDLTKKECSLIELTSTINGSHQYDLPATMKKDSNPKRARRDSYTALLLAAWGVKCYFDLNRQLPQAEFIFSPRMFR